MWMTRLTVRWLGVQRYDGCVSETEKQKADCEYLVFGPKVLTVVALVMVATARLGLKTGCRNLYLAMQQPDFFTKYTAVVFETAESRRGLGTAIMKYARKSCSSVQVPCLTETQEMGTLRQPPLWSSRTMAQTRVTHAQMARRKSLRDHHKMDHQARQDT